MVEKEGPFHLRQTLPTLQPLGAPVRSLPVSQGHYDRYNLTGQMGWTATTMEFSALFVRLGEDAVATVTIKVHPPGGTIILDRPKRRNAVSRELVQDLSQALSDLHQEKRVRAVILTGSGSDFSAGLDLSEIHAAAAESTPTMLPNWHEQWSEMRDLFEQMLRYPKPLIAAVDGAALGTVSAWSWHVTWSFPPRVRGTVFQRSCVGWSAVWSRRSWYGESEDLQPAGSY